MHVTDIIPNREFLLTRAYYNRQNGLDVNGGTHPFSATPGTDTPATAVHDTEINWNYAVIERLDPNDLTTHLEPFALGEAIANPGGPQNKPLSAGDVIVVYSRNDVALPLELQAKFVRIDGQVKAPGVYRVGAEETLRDLVARRRRAWCPTPTCTLPSSRAIASARSSPPSCRHSSRRKAVRSFPRQTSGPALPEAPPIWSFARHISPSSARPSLMAA